MMVVRQYTVDSQLWTQFYLNLLQDTRISAYKSQKMGYLSIVLLYELINLAGKQNKNGWLKHVGTANKPITVEHLKIQLGWLTLWVDKSVNFKEVFKSTLEFEFIYDYPDGCFITEPYAPNTFDENGLSLGKGLWAKVSHKLMRDDRIMALKNNYDGFIAIAIYYELIMLTRELDQGGYLLLEDGEKPDISLIGLKLREPIERFGKAFQKLINLNLVVEDEMGFRVTDEYQPFDLVERTVYMKRLRQKRYRGKREDPTEKQSDVLQESLNFDTPVEDRLWDRLPERHLDRHLNRHLDRPPDRLMTDTKTKNLSTPLDKDVDKDIDKDKDINSHERRHSNTHGTSSSKLKFPKEEEEVIIKYVEYRSRSGDIHTTKKGYDFMVRSNAIEDPGEFVGMQKYIDNQDKEKEFQLQQEKTKQAKQKGQENRQIAEARIIGIEEARVKLRQDWLLDIKKLPKTTKPEIQKRTEKKIQEYNDKHEKTLGSLLEKKSKFHILLQEGSSIIAYKEWLLEHLALELKGERKAKVKYDRNKNNRHFAIDFADAHGLTLDRTEELLKEHQVTHYENYSLQYREEELSPTEKIDRFITYGWLKDEPRFDN